MSSQVEKILDLNFHRHKNKILKSKVPPIKLMLIILIILYGHNL